MADTADRIPAGGTGDRAAARRPVSCQRSDPRAVAQRDAPGPGPGMLRALQRQAGNAGW